jgi:hypothetical protein
MSQKLSDGHYQLPELSIQDLILLRHLTMLVTTVTIRNHFEALLEAETTSGALKALEGLALQSRAQFDFHNEFYAVMRVMEEDGPSSLMLIPAYREFGLNVVKADAVNLTRNPHWAEAVKRQLGMTPEAYYEAIGRLRKALEEGIWVPPEKPQVPEEEEEIQMTMRGPRERA